MGREVRMVTKDWEHPKNDGGSYIPLFYGNYEDVFEDWLKDKKEWENGIYPSYCSEDCKKLSYEEYSGEDAPQWSNYMPAWTEDEAIYYMMYEDTTEGTPISPAFKKPEDLAMWLYENKASSFGKSTASYEAWLNMIVGSGFSICGVLCNGELKDGVSALLDCKEKS